MAMTTGKTMGKTICLEFNELNFDAMAHYMDKGLLSNFRKLIELHGLIETTSEREYEELEPWIQWVTAHTGKTLAEHGVFRLGDIVNTEHEQIWEVIEGKGYKVGAISPMNAKNRTSSAPFFVPDPWTATRPSGNRALRGVYDAIRQAVNDNAQARIAPSSVAWLLAGFALYARPVNYAKYVKLALGSRANCWYKALFLDLLLSDVYITLMKRQPVDFSTIFLNAGAHIQHHYMFSSEAYKGENKNPAWYVGPGKDPVLDVYTAYDDVLGQMLAAFPDARFLVMTGLHQDPHHKTEYYWRLKEHASFLDRHGIRFARVEPRMSRDFLVTCANAEDAASAAERLGAMRAADGQELFMVDRKGDSVFVTLTYPDDIGEDFEYMSGNATYRNFRADVAFVAIKNGKHNGVGYLIDTQEDASVRPAEMPLTAVFGRLVEAA